MGARHAEGPARGRARARSSTRRRTGAGSAYFAVYRYLLGDYAPYIYKTDDYGKTWKRLTDGKNGIPADTPTRVVREDPNREGLLYAGTEFGMYISFDDGAHWQPFFLNMPQIPINDIKIHRKDLLVATQGRAFWILDNLSVLHQLTPAVTTARGHAVRAARRLSHARERRRCSGRCSSTTCRRRRRARCTIEMLDAKGAVVNTYSSDDAGGRAAGGAAGAAARAGRRRRGPGAADPDAAPPGRGRGGRRAPRVTKDAGINRVVWNVRNRDGVTMPPGPYQVRLTVGRRHADAAVQGAHRSERGGDGVTVADLQEQFAHNVRMRAMVTEREPRWCRSVRDAQAKLDGATGADAGKAKASRRHRRQAADRAGALRQARPAGAHPVPGRHDGGVDQKIGRDAVERYAELRKELDAVRAEMDRVLGSTAGARKEN